MSPHTRTSPTIHALLHRVIDYAGMFPPARLSQSATAANYARYRTGSRAWLLGSLVVPASTARTLAVEADGEPPWAVNVVASAAAIDGVFQAEAAWGGRAKVAAIEFPPVAVADIGGIRARVRPQVDAIFEIAIPDRTSSTDLSSQLDAIARARGVAKMRTGGITADAFPSPAVIYQFLRGCAERGLACKATAGLHHAMTGRYSPTEDEGSERVRMFGFLNLCVLAALVLAGCTEQEAHDLLREENAQALRFKGEVAEWRDRSLPAAVLADARRRLLRSFGSCSFAVPVEELDRLGLI